MMNTVSAKYACAIMERAVGLVGGDRQVDYGDFYDNVLRISERTSVPIMSVCDVLVALKEVRLGHSPMHDDSSVDVVAYTALREAVRHELHKGATNNGG